MLKTLQLKLATNRVKGKKQMNKKITKKKTGFWATALKIVSWPFRMAWRLLCAIWNWVRSLDLIGLINLTLLIAIIVLFTMLIIDICNCGKKTVVLVAPETVPAKVEVTKPTLPVVKPAAPERVKITLPLKNNVAKNATVIKNTKTVSKNCNNGGDVIIDGELPGTKISHCEKIDGNLYLQNMRKYTLPCGVVIDGDLFIRNVGLVQFCGEFTVTGNIYVTRSSSFGPIPRTARIGGQVIL